MQKYQDVVLSRQGTPIQGAKVTVTDTSGGAVAIYAANAIGDNVNPVITNEDGRFSFYAPDGRYNLSVSVGGNVLATVTDILLEDPEDGSDAVFGDVTIEGTLSDASKISFDPAGGVSATNVQAAIAEVDSEKASLSALSASTGAAMVGVDDGESGALFTQLQQAIELIQWGEQSHPAGVNILRYIPPTEWTAIVGNTSTYDATDAFTAAQLAHKNVYAPAGTYVLNGLRIYNGCSIIGAGLKATTFKQKAAGTPAINCLSDVTTGQLSSVTLSGFLVEGATSATVAAVLVAGYGAYAVYGRSRFSFGAKNTFRALEVQASDAANVFDCHFDVFSEGTTSTAVFINGGAYNSFRLWLMQCQSLALDDRGSEGEVRVIAEGPISVTGQKNRYIKPTVENLPQFVGTTVNLIKDQGFGNSFETPSVIFNAAASAKVTGAVMQTFVGTEVYNPQFIFPDATKVADPFGPSAYAWKLSGPGRSECTNKIESVWNGADNSRDLSNITMIGMDASFTDQQPKPGYMVTQYSAPTGSVNVQIRANAEHVLLEPSGTIAVVNFSFLRTVRDGRTLLVSTTQTLTSVSWSSSHPSGADVSALPTTMAAGTKLRIQYKGSTNKWYVL